MRGAAPPVHGQVTQPYRYAGAYFDGATTLYKMGARYYDPATGRFTQRDSMPASSYNPLEYNRYTYVAGNPVNATDATGYAQWCDEYCGGGGPRRYQGGSNRGGIRGITYPLYTVNHPFGQHNAYSWGYTGRVDNAVLRRVTGYGGPVLAGLAVKYKVPVFAYGSAALWASNYFWEHTGWNLRYGRIGVGPFGPLGYSWMFPSWR